MLDPLSLDIIVAICGMIVGSFLMVVITRYPAILKQQWRIECRDFLALPPEEDSTKLSIASPRSHCPHCSNPIKAYDNIPIFSYLLLRGKCRQCKRPINLLYPFVELLTAVLSIIVVRHFGLSWQMFGALLFTYLLITLALIDLHHQILPDTLTLSALWIGLIANSFNFITHLNDAVWASIIGYSFLWMLAWIFLKLRKKQGMGHGDFKMLAMIGAWLGFYSMVNSLLLAILISVVSGTIFIFYRQEDWSKAIPFGPFLAIGAWISLLWGHFLINFLQIT